MITRPLCYIVAPYRADTPEAVAVNIARAEFIGRIAVAAGLAPIVVHSQIRGVFAVDDTDADEATRAVGMECCLSVLRAVCDGGGLCWALVDGEPSEGTGIELGTWDPRWNAPPLVRDWAGWCWVGERYGLVAP